MTTVQKQIFAEMIRALELLGAQSDLLSIVCSFQDTLPDETVLEYLREWNAIYAPSGNKSVPSVDL